MADTQPAKLQPASQQVTSKISTTAPAKNPKRVATGKAVAEETRQARKAQKKAASETAVIIASNKAKETPAPHVLPAVEDTSRNVHTTTQWLSVVSIFVSMVGLYYKREEIKRVFSKPQTPPPSSDSSTQQRSPPPSPEMQRQPEKGIRPMD